jgi:hypothetical protein
MERKVLSPHSQDSTSGLYPEPTESKAIFHNLYEAFNRSNMTFGLVGYAFWRMGIGSVTHLETKSKCSINTSYVKGKAIFYYEGHIYSVTDNWRMASGESTETKEH